MDRVDATEASARNRAARSVNVGTGADLAVAERQVLPVAVEDGHAPGAARRTGRGHIDSFGVGRTCSTVGCSTLLSRYNQRDVCGLHDLRNGQR